MKMRVVIEALKYGRPRTLAKASRSSRAHKNAAAPLRDGRTYCLRRGGSSGSDVVETLGVQAGAGRQRLNRLAGELDELLGELGAFGDHAVERSAGQFALELEEL